jgi:thiol-disulfide isomerase/thioredoxin
MRGWAFFSVLASAHAIQLTADNFVEKTTNKVVFIKFATSWCEHCKRLVPFWKQLDDAFENGDYHENALIGEIDCGANADQALCNELEINGYPALRWGDATLGLRDYHDDHKGLDFEAFDEFARERVKPVCGPRNLDECGPSMRRKLEEVMAMPTSELEDAIAQREKENEDAQKAYRDVKKALMAQYADAYDKKQGAYNLLDSTHLKMTELVIEHKRKTGQEEL